jgi:UDP-glucose 4-epimerase
MKILVTGAAGFIGSVTAAYLLDHGYEINVLDDLSEGHEHQIDSRANFFQGSILDFGAINEAITNCQAVVHLAGKAIVSESTQDPDKYQLHNFIGTRNLLISMIDNSIKQIVFSSTCAVYGNPNIKSISEQVKPVPVNPYGNSKLLADLEISNFTEKHNLNSVSLRFFNVAGSYTNKLGKLFGELHKNETHLIPRILKERNIEIYGSDFNTPDGTCVRDYVHVLDIAHAIKLSLENKTSSSHRIYNLGSGKGASVRDIIQVVESTLNIEITTKSGKRRAGDPDYLVSNSNLARKEIGWATRFDLKQIITDTQKFLEKNS